MKRENELRPEMPTSTVVGRWPDGDRAQMLDVVAHTGLGATTAAAAQVLMAMSGSSMKAAMPVTVGIGAFVLAAGRDD